MTQSDLADLVSVAQSSLARYENGTMRPTLEVVKKIANVLEVSVDELLNDFVEERPKITLSSALPDSSVTFKTGCFSNNFFL